MDLLAIVSSLRRHWVITVVMTLLTVVGALGVVALTPRVYNSNASFVLVNPEPQPSGAELLVDPSLAGVNWDNPYLRFANEGTVGQVLAARMSSDSVRGALSGQGADPDYEVSQSAVSSQIIDVVGTGSTAEAADATLALVNQRMEDELAAMQKVYGADDRTLITLLPVATPTSAHLMVSGTIRTLVGVGAAGALLLFAAISLAEARRHAREEVEEARRPTTGRHGYTGPQSPGGRRERSGSTAAEIQPEARPSGIDVIRTPHGGEESDLADTGPRSVRLQLSATAGARDA
ncbi:capsular polysaccharide biosynthesis protein [Geodermatophilus normandii]|uniref:Capsular polysaccharide biosynthesis protein n=1 Tax=Geodermatophilus normandii TaxID=1137989 RepID=A0A317QGE6_9ACTN|nr:Wzz/FepE/Etk N-terminal domain-containing protein [Geodermatophilus normandii]PWW21375.1 capsular polysaccharide biosynthesis protein [Geodermatophilus normandii]